MAHLGGVDPSVLPLPPSSCLSGLTYKYPSCESVTDEYAGHIIQILKQEGGNSDLIMDQYANRLAYRSVKSGLQEAAKTAKVKCSSKIFPVQSSQMKTNDELLLFLNKEHQQEADKKDKAEVVEVTFIKTRLVSGHGTRAEMSAQNYIVFQPVLLTASQEMLQKS